MNLSRDASPSKVQPAAETEGFLLKLVKKRVFGKSRNRRSVSFASAAPSPRTTPPSEDLASDDTPRTTSTSQETSQKITKRNQRKEPKLVERLLSQEKNIRDILGKIQNMQEDKREERNTSEEQLQLMVKMEEKVKDMEEERREEWTKSEERIRQMMTMTEKIMKMQEKIKTMEDERREERSRWEQRFQLSVQREEDFKHKEEERKQERSHWEQERRQERSQWQQEKLLLNKEKEALSQQLLATEQKNGESMKQLEEGRREERSQWEQEKLLLVRGKEDMSHKFLSAEQKNEDMKYEMKTTENKFLKLKEELKHMQEEKKRLEEEKTQLLKEKEEVSQKLLCSEQKKDFLLYEASSNQSLLVKLEENLTEVTALRAEERKVWEEERFQLLVEKEALTQKLLSAEQRVERARSDAKATEEWTNALQEEVKRSEEQRREEKQKREQERSASLQEKQALTQRLLVVEQTQQQERNQMKEKARSMETSRLKTQEEIKGLEQERRQERKAWEEGRREERSQWEEGKRRERSQWEEERRQERDQWDEARRKERSQWEQEKLLLVRGKEDMSHKFLSAEQKNEDMKYEMKTTENKFLKLKEELKHMQEEKTQVLKEKEELSQENQHLKANEEQLLQTLQEMREEQRIQLLTEKEALGSHQMFLPIELTEEYVNMENMRNQMNSKENQVLQMQESVRGLEDERVLQMQESVRGLEDERREDKRAFEEERIWQMAESWALSQRFTSSEEERERARNETSASECEMLRLREQMSSMEEQRRQEEESWEEERIRLVAEMEALSQRFFSGEEHEEMTTTLRLQEQLRHVEEEKRTLEEEKRTLEEEKRSLKRTLEEEKRSLEEEKRTLEEERAQLVTEKELLSQRLLSTEQQKEHLRSQEGQMLRLQQKIKVLEEERREEKKKHWEEKLQLSRDVEALSQRFLFTEQRNRQGAEEGGSVIENKWTNHFSSADLCELTLDPNTAHVNLSLSNNNRKVTYVAERQPYPEHADRFRRWEQVLFHEGLTQRYYWEVEWSGVVSIAVTYRGIGRGHAFGNDDASWSLECFEAPHGNRYIVRHNAADTVVPVCPSGSNRVGVCLDWPDGTLRFYRISSDTMTDLYTFQVTFTQPLYPGFWCWALGSSVSLCQIEEVQ